MFNKNIYKFYILTGCIIFFGACQKEISVPTDVISPPPAPSVEQFTKYTIKKGNQYCDENKFTITSYLELKFTVKFDSSAIYKSVLPENQYDINKLYGFSDNNSDHHQFSARFGWRWSDNALRLFGYIYNNGIRDSSKLGPINIGEIYNCSIKVTPHNYIFSLNGVSDSLPRTSTTIKAEGYKLYPYFGGDEVAPHDIYILIKEL